MSTHRVVWPRVAGLPDLQYLVGLATYCPRLVVVSTTDNEAWELGPLFKKWMTQSLSYLRTHGITIVPLDAFIAKSRPHTVIGNPMHLTGCAEVHALWDEFFESVVEFIMTHITPPVCDMLCSDLG